MRKVAVCVETASEVMKSNLVLAEGGQVRRFAPLLARELAVPVIEQSGPNCGKTAKLMGIKYFHPGLCIDESWLNPANTHEGDDPLSSILQAANLWYQRDKQDLRFRGNQDNWFDLLSGSILQGRPVEIHIANYHSQLLPPNCMEINLEESAKKLKPIYGKNPNHGFVAVGFGSDGSVIFNNWGARWILSKRNFQIVWGWQNTGYEGFSFFGYPLSPYGDKQPQTSSASEAKDDTLALEKNK